MFVYVCTYNVQDSDSFLYLSAVFENIIFTYGEAVGNRKDIGKNGAQDNH